jgi:hypothetical protein
MACAHPWRIIYPAIACLLLTAWPLAAQTPPSILLSDPSGQITVRAIRTDTPPRIDGRLDEVLYGKVTPLSNLIQTEPSPGAPATEKTEVWIFFDHTHIYVSVKCWESHPERRVANDMRRDSPGVSQGNDNIAFMFDTFHDKRNANTFAVNSLGGRNDGQVTNQRQYNADWNPIWSVKAQRSTDGWSFEAAIPFKSLRYGPGREQTWGFNIVRTVRWKNEIAFLTRVPPAIGANAGIMYASFAATMVGLEAPPGSGRVIEVKPFVTASATTDLTATPRVRNDPVADAGLDVKYGITGNLTADFTINTDFAQVEADEQQVNLTRFSLFFPEKRDFFLENQGVFAFGGSATGFRGGDVPLMFYSRRIGLDAGHEVPIAGGGRITGRIGQFNIGALHISTRRAPKAQVDATQFSVLRLKRDLFRKSSIGGIVTHRSRVQGQLGSNDAYGVDGNFVFYDNLFLNAYWAETRTAGTSDDARSYRAQLDYGADRYGLQLERLHIGAGFAPEIGFVRRTDQQKNYVLARFSPRLLGNRTFRKLSWVSTFSHVKNSRGGLDTRDVDVSFTVDLQNSDRFSVSAHDAYDFVPKSFRAAGAVTVPVGVYWARTARGSYTFGPQRNIFGTIAVEKGSFFGGYRLTMTFSGARARILTQLSAEPSFSINRLRMPAGDVTVRLIGSRLTYSLTPMSFASALVQYNSSTRSLSVNARLRWEYVPGSELFVVFNEQRDTLGTGYPDLTNRAFIVKINRLVRF